MGLGSVLQSVFGGGNAPTWRNVIGEDVNDKRYYLTPEQMGADVARENQLRYGFQGVYQKFLISEQQRMMEEESRRVMRMATNLTPGAAAFRTGLSAQGLSSNVSNIMAKNQREAALSKALDYGVGAVEDYAGKLGGQYLQLTGQNEAMRSGWSENLMKSIQGANMYNVQKYGDLQTKIKEWDYKNRMAEIGQMNKTWEAQNSMGNQALGAGMYALGGGFGGLGNIFTDTPVTQNAPPDFSKAPIPPLPKLPEIKLPGVVFKPMPTSNFGWDGR